MKEKLSILNYKYKVSIIAFMFFLVLFSITPLSGDVIEISLTHSGNFLEMFKDGSRDIDLYLVSFFANNRLFFNILFSGLLAIFIYNANSLISEVRNKHFYLFVIILMLLVSYFTFSYNYMSIKGAVTYTIPSLLMLLYFIRFKVVLNNKNNFIFFLLSLIIIINLNVLLGIIFLIGNIIYFILNKNLNKKFLIVILLVGIVNVLYKKGFNFDSNIFINNYSSFKENISLSIKSIFSNNILLFILGMVPINYYLKEKLPSNMYRRVIVFMINIPLFFSLSYNFGNYIPVNFELILTKYSGVFALENYYFIGYFLLYIYLLVLTTIYFVKNNYLKNILISLETIFIILFILSTLMKNIDQGIYIFILLSMVLIILILFTEIKIKIYPRMVILFAFLFVSYYLSIFTLVRVLENKRVEFIKKEISEFKHTIVIPANPIRILYRTNPDNWDKDLVKKYYNIPEDKDIDVFYIGIFKKIEERVK